MSIRQNISAAFPTRTPRLTRKPRKVKAGNVMRASSFNDLIAAVIALQEAQK
jgi:hypothetical protein